MQSNSLAVGGDKVKLKLINQGPFPTKSSVDNSIVNSAYGKSSRVSSSYRANSKRDNKMMDANSWAG